MLANPNQAADTWSVHHQGLLLGEAVADQVNNGHTVTEVLTGLLQVGPMDLIDATSIVRLHGRAAAA